MSKAPKDFVRDIQAVAMADYDLDIDYRIVSIVQMAPESVEVGDPDPGRRLRRGPGRRRDPAGPHEHQREQGRRATPSSR